MIPLRWMLMGCLLGAHGAARADGSEDICRAPFIECVQETGNPLECQSVYQNCLAAPTVARGGQEFITGINVTSQGTASLAQITVTNNTDAPVDIDAQSVRFICADGRLETGYFTFRPQLGAGQSLVSQPQQLCVDNGPATYDEAVQVGPIDGPPGSHGDINQTRYILYCDAGTTQPFAMEWLREGVLQAEKDGITFTFNMSDSDVSSVITRVCGSTGLGETTFHDQLRTTVLEIMQSGGMQSAPGKTTVTGVRG